MFITFDELLKPLVKFCAVSFILVTWREIKIAAFEIKTMLNVD
jgi:hypothetical protein